MLGVCLCCYVLFCHLMVCSCHTVHGFFDQSTCLVFSLLSNQRLLEGSCLIMFLVPCFGMDLLPTYGFGLTVFVQPEVVGGLFCGIYRDTHFICFGNMCSLPSHSCLSSCICSCFAVLSCY